MDYSQQVNKIPYTEYGELLFSGKLITIRVNYDEGYTIVSDTDGVLWKVTCDADDIRTAILTKIE